MKDDIQPLFNTEQKIKEYKRSIVFVDAIQVFYENHSDPVWEQKL